MAKKKATEEGVEEESEGVYELRTFVRVKASLAEEFNGEEGKGRDVTARPPGEVFNLLYPVDVADAPAEVTDAGEEGTF